MSTNKKPINNASVEVNGKRTQTDKWGRFRISFKAKVSKSGNRFIFNIRKEGYGLLSKIYRSGVQNGQWLLTAATSVVIDPTRNNLVIDRRQDGDCTGSLSSQVDWFRFEHRRTPHRVDEQGSKG